MWYFGTMLGSKLGSKLGITAENVAEKSHFLPRFPTLPTLKNNEKAADFNVSVDFSGFSHSLWCTRRDSNPEPPHS